MSYEYRYNAAGIIERIDNEFDSSEQLIKSTQIFYDATGNLIKTTIYDVDGNIINSY